MEKKETISYEYTFTRKEAVQILAALDYVHHRQKSHGKAKHVNPELLEVMRSFLR